MTNTVELIGHYGGDRTHALSAWTSTERELTEDKRQRIDKLLNFLAKNGHHTPFEKSYLHFLVRCDTASHIHLLKHRIGVSINGESARYKELGEPTFLLPEDWPQEIRDSTGPILLILKDYYKKLIRDLEPALGRKRAKESARFLLPYANQLTLDVGFNFRSFMHFQGLRNKEDAQLEIQQIAQNMLELVRETGYFKYSLAGFGY